MFLCFLYCFVLFFAFLQLCVGIHTFEKKSHLSQSFWTGFVQGKLHHSAQLEILHVELVSSWKKEHVGASSSAILLISPPSHHILIFFFVLLYGGLWGIRDHAVTVYSNFIQANEENTNHIRRKLYCKGRRKCFCRRFSGKAVVRNMFVVRAGF